MAPPLYRTGKICYLEMPALDVHVSAAFYEDAFGWNIRFRDTARPSFDDTTGGVSGAWVTDRKPDPDPGILPYIMVADAVAASERVVAAGGTMVLQAGQHGTEVLGTFLDPAGNLIGIYQEPGLAESEAAGGPTNRDDQPE